MQVPLFTDASYTSVQRPLTFNHFHAHAEALREQNASGGAGVKKARTPRRGHAHHPKDTHAPVTHQTVTDVSLGKIDLGAHHVADNPLTTGLLRYIGYTNEVGEAFASMLSKGAIAATYRVVEYYAFADALLTGNRAYNKALQAQHSNKQAIVEGVTAGVDQGAFQFLASWLIPAYFVGQAREFVEEALHQTPKQNAKALLNKIPGVYEAGQQLGKSKLFAQSKMLQKAAPIVVAVGLIPLVVKPIDHGVQFVLDWTLRPVWDKGIKPWLMNTLAKEQECELEALAYPAKSPRSSSET